MCLCVSHVFMCLTHLVAPQKNEEVLKKQVAALSTKERTLSYQCEQEQAAIRKLEQAKINGHAVRSSSEELEIEAVAELKRVEERVKLLTRAELYKDSLKDLAKSTLVDQIAEETANLKSAKDAIRALVGKKGIRKANEEVKKTQKK